MAATDSSIASRSGLLEPLALPIHESLLIRFEAANGLVAEFHSQLRDWPFPKRKSSGFGRL